MRTRLLFIAVLVCLVSGCSFQKTLQQAEVYQEAGMHQEAFKTYQAAWEQKPKAEAHVGMRNAAEAYVSACNQSFRSCMFSGDYACAADHLDAAQAFVAKHADMKLAGAASLEGMERELDLAYRDSHYAEAEALVQEGQYDAASKMLRKLLRRYPDFEQAEYLLLMAEIYPAYNTGVAAMDKRLYQQAYYQFLEVTRRDAGFKDALELRDECVELGAFRMAYIPVLNRDVDRAVENQLAATIKQDLLGAGNPFIQLLDRESTHHLLEEQQQGLSGLFDESKAAAAGKLEGAEYVLTVEVIAFDESTGRKRTQEHKGWLGPHMRSEKVRYATVQQESELDARVRCQIINAETGRVHVSELVPFHQHDRIHYASYSGPSKDLYPGTWVWGIIGSRNDRIDLDGYEELQELLEARHDLIEMRDMELAFYNAVSKAITDALFAFEPAGR